MYDLIKKVKSKEIVIYKTDKDGKLIVLNYDDYNTIMNRELNIFKKIDKINLNNIEKYFENIRNKVKDFMINLHKLNYIDDKILKHTFRITFTQKLQEHSPKTSIVTNPSTPTLYLKPINWKIFYKPNM